VWAGPWGSAFCVELEGAWAGPWVRPFVLELVPRRGWSHTRASLAESGGAHWTDESLREPGLPARFSVPCLV